MTGRSIRIGALGAGALAAFYIAVITWASGAEHLADQASADWPYLAAIIAGFGIQVALLVELRHRRRARHLEQAGAAGMPLICLVIVTPSSQTSGVPHFRSNRTLRASGPNVARTASATADAPASSFVLACLRNRQLVVRERRQSS